MADPISVSSGIVALATFAYQSSKSLYQLIESFRNQSKTIRELKNELEALDQALVSLNETVSADQDELSALKIPLLRCGHACNEFQEVVTGCTKHSGQSRASFRDWAKLTYMGDDISSFRYMLSGYKATISIALGNINFRKMSVTTEVLKDYKVLINTTASDLQEHLVEIDTKLQSLLDQTHISTQPNDIERQQIQEEKKSTEQCLTICRLISERVNQLQPQDVESLPCSLQSDVGTHKVGSSAKQITSASCNDIKQRLYKTVHELEERVRRPRLGLQDSPKMKAWGINEFEQSQVQEEREGILNCLKICTEALTQANEKGTNRFEDVSTGDDSHQVIVSTLGDLIDAKRIIAGPRSSQWLGQMADDSLQALSRSVDTSHLVETPQDTAQGTWVTGMKYANKYGNGRRLD